uniref:Uncharacterized protein n=1 Tax=Physcomitrium patens TaxID=3218 RepID=A0A2K1J7J5_PHYPA|nr:hypothetical protein PHYPA_020605 [Physcomitrium patens]
MQLYRPALQKCWSMHLRLERKKGMQMQWILHCFLRGEQLQFAKFVFQDYWIISAIFLQRHASEH